MAQIYGVQNHQRTSTSTSSTGSSSVNSGSAHNTFVFDGGIELMLHEMDPPSINSSSSSSFISSAKKRGRPRKDAPPNPVASAQSSFDGSPAKDDEKRLKRERKKLLKLELRKEKKMKKFMRNNEANSNANTNNYDDDDDNRENYEILSITKKRGRPRKQVEFEDAVVLTNSDTLTPIYSEISETDCVALNHCTINNKNHRDNVQNNNNKNRNEEFTMMEILNLNHEEEAKPDEIFEAIETKWTPIQRLTQFNQALAFTSMYKDVIFWDRIVAEFTVHSLRFRLELGSEKSFDIPFLVLSKFFWICAQLGLQRTQFLFTGLSEKFADDNNVDLGGVLFNSSESLIYSHMCNDRIMVIQRASQLIKFDSNAKISEWTIHINKHEEFHKTTAPDSKKDLEELVWGFPKRAIEFLDVALVMSSVLTDSVSWLTWFYTYIQQSGLKNFSIVELSRAPSPFQFPSYDDPSIISDLAVGMDFFDKGRDFIFNVLNTANMDVPAGIDPIPEEFSFLQNSCEAVDAGDVGGNVDDQIHSEQTYEHNVTEQTYDQLYEEQSIQNATVIEVQQTDEFVYNQVTTSRSREEQFTFYPEPTDGADSGVTERLTEATEHPTEVIEHLSEVTEHLFEAESPTDVEPYNDCDDDCESLEIVISDAEEDSDDFFDSYN